MAYRFWILGGLLLLVISGCQRAAVQNEKVAHPQPKRPADDASVARAKAFEVPKHPGVTYQNFHTNRRFQKQLPYPVSEKPWAPDYELLNAACYHAANRKRVEMGKQPVPYHPFLERVASDYAKILAERNELTHVLPKGVTFILNPANPGDHDQGPCARLLGRDDPVPEGAIGCRVRDRSYLAGQDNPTSVDIIGYMSALANSTKRRLYRHQGKWYRAPNGKQLIPPHTYASLAIELAQSWHNSPAHRKFLLHDKSTFAGCGLFAQTVQKLHKIYATHLQQLYFDIKLRGPGVSVGAR